MKSILTINFFCFLIFSCLNSEKSNEKDDIDEIYDIIIKEPIDSSKYTLIKYDFYQDEYGELYERKLVFNERDEIRNYNFLVCYDNRFMLFQNDTVIEKNLKDIVDINTFEDIDSTGFSKDKNHVYYFHANSCGGIRVIVENANPKTFRRLYEYRYGIDDKNVYYKVDRIKNINLNKLTILYSKDTSDHFVRYIKDNKNVYFENNLIEHADAKTFETVNNKKFDAQDKNHKYNYGQILE